MSWKENVSLQRIIKTFAQPMQDPPTDHTRAI